MRILAIYVGGGCTEWCSVVNEAVTGGVLPGDGMWSLVEQAIDQGLLGSDEDPLSIAVGGAIPHDHKIDLQTWEVATPGAEVVFYSGWEVADCCRAIRRATGPVFAALHRHGLLDPEAPMRRAAAIALGLAHRLSS